MYINIQVGNIYIYKSVEYDWIYMCSEEAIKVYNS